MLGRSADAAATAVPLEWGISRDGKAARNEVPSMSRTLIALAAGLGASALVAVAVLAAGGALRPTPAPIPASQAGPAGCAEARLHEQSDSGITGRARLCILDEGVRPAIEAEALAPGTAYTAWFAYFDRPRQCRLARCGTDDLLGEDPAGVVGRMAGAVADGTRKADFWGDFRDLRLSGGSQVVLFIFGHGPADSADNRRRTRQLLTIQSPRLGAPAAGAPSDGARAAMVAEAIFDLP